MTAEPGKTVLRIKGMRPLTEAEKAEMKAFLAPSVAAVRAKRLATAAKPARTSAA